MRGRKNKSSTSYRAGYFDMRGDVPTEVLGYETKEIRSLIGKAGVAQDAAHEYLDSKGKRLPAAVDVAMWESRIHPADVIRLTEMGTRVLSGLSIEPADIGASRKMFKRMAKKLPKDYWVQKAMKGHPEELAKAKRAARALRWGDRLGKIVPPFRRSINTRFDTLLADQINTHAPTMRTKFVERLDTIAPEVEEYLAMFESIPGGPRHMIDGDIRTFIESMRGYMGKDVDFGTLGKALEFTVKKLQDDPDVLDTYAWLHDTFGTELPDMPEKVNPHAYEIIAPTLVQELGKCLPEDDDSREFCMQVGSMVHPYRTVARFASPLTTYEGMIRDYSRKVRVIPRDPSAPRRLYADVSDKLHTLVS